MKFSLNWIKEYLDEKEGENLNSPKGLAFIEQRLIQKSFEIESIDQKDNDIIFDLCVLPNRSHDCFCHRGVASEIAAVTDLKFIDKKYPTNDSVESGTFSVSVASDMCSRYIGCEVKNVHVGPSPKELKEKLESIGERSINNIVDITNVVMFELGQPMHAFDTDKISGTTITARYASKGESVTTLDNKQITLDEGVTVIADEKEVLAIAGIKGGKKAEVNSDTFNIILEAAHFNSTHIRKNVKKLGIATESSRRFENQITAILAEKGIAMTLELIKKYASTPDTKIYSSVEYYPQPINTFYTGITAREVSKMLGMSVTDQDMEKSLNALGFQYRMMTPGKNIVELAHSLIGKKYKWGAHLAYDAPEFFDCSAFVSYIYSHSGVIIPRVSVDQYVYGIPISKEELLPGDLIFSINPDVMVHGIHMATKEFLPGTPVEHGVDHVGVYVGDNKIIHATNWNESGVILEDIDHSQRFRKIVGYRRYFDHAEMRCVIRIPDERIDLMNIDGKFEMKHIDLIEEIGRIIGYDSIPTAPIQIDNYAPHINKEYYFNNKIRVALVGVGFSEVMTYSFVEKGELMPEKPLAEDKKYVRGDLLTGMNAALDHNIKYVDLLNIDRVAIFGIGKVFRKDYTELLQLSIGVRNKTGIKKPKAVELLRQAVQTIEEIVGQKINISISDTTESIQINLGELYEKVTLPTDIVSYQYVPEPANIIFKSISNYPFISRDVAVWIPKDQKASDLVDIIKTHSGTLLANEPRCFDVYEKEGRVSYAYRMVFQSYEKTLTDVEANEIMEKIYADIKAKGDWEIR